ncbi:MAG TPA: prepilin-type N-terminal cleavage/methylation domain-containing protein [Tepidisphaeraceae bacterium]|jgi:prepilin-type N-terminal cleavage/methylation domain-containing protein
MRRRGFTIIELLVVIGILGLLMALLLPVLWRVRGEAMKVVCSARLRDLTLAATMYQNDHKVLPEALKAAAPSPTGPATFRPAPHQISGTLLNELRPYLNFPEVWPTTPVTALPPFLQCPFIEGQDDDRGPFRSVITTSSDYYTGYVYLGRISEIAVAAAPPPPPTAAAPLALVPLPVPLTIPLPSLPIIGGLVSMLEPGIELRPGRAASARPTKRAVLWADNVRQVDSTGDAWQYTHARRAARGNGAITYPGPTELLGQHRAFTDGSVEWVDAGTEELKVELAPLSVRPMASLKTLAGDLWWY